MSSTADGPLNKIQKCHVKRSVKSKVQEQKIKNEKLFQKIIVARK